MTQLPSKITIQSKIQLFKPKKLKQKANRRNRETLNALLKLHKVLQCSKPLQQWIIHNFSCSYFNSTLPPEFSSFHNSTETFLLYSTKMVFFMMSCPHYTLNPLNHCNTTTITCISIHFPPYCLYRPLLPTEIHYAKLTPGSQWAIKVLWTTAGGLVGLAEKERRFLQRWHRSFYFLWWIVRLVGWLVSCQRIASNGSKFSKSTIWKQTIKKVWKTWYFRNPSN